MPLTDQPPDSLGRAVERRNAAIAHLAAMTPAVLERLWRDANPNIVLEVYAQLAEACGTAKMAAATAGVQPVPLPRSVTGASVSGNGKTPVETWAPGR